MTLATPYISYAGYHDAKSYPSVAETQGKLVLPIDIYDQDLDFLSYTDRSVLIHRSATLCISANPRLSFYPFDSDLSSNNSSAPSPLGSPMEHADQINLIMSSPYTAWDEPSETMSTTSHNHNNHNNHDHNNSRTEGHATPKGETKAQCWEHGCNGRVFSTWSNLKRHQKEKSGNAKKVLCPQCGGEFTRVTARDTHLAKGSCNRIRRYSNGRQRPSRVALLEMLMQQPGRESAV